MKVKVEMYVGDLHGNLYALEKAIERYETYKPDKIIFVGDYCDSYTATNVEILFLLKELLQLKLDNPDKVELLLGNHDVQYIYECAPECSGMRPAMKPVLNKFFTENRRDFNIAYQSGNVLCTHAGVTKAWWKEHYGVLREMSEKFTLNPLDDIGKLLNMIQHTKDAEILFEVGRACGGWNHGGPLWTRPTEIKEDLLIGDYHHVFGHTPVSCSTTDTVWEYTDPNVKRDGIKHLYTNIDCLDVKTEFFFINNSY